MFIAKLIPTSILSSQARKPAGIIGRLFMARMFNHAHADLNKFIQELLAPQRTDKILEIGFGSGKALHDIAKTTTEGVVEGIDHSYAMVQHATKINKHDIAAGKVILHEGECSSLPCSSGSFDKVYTSNTIYFWKEPEKYFNEMFRVIKRGGMIVIGFRDDKQMKKLNIDKNIFSLYSLSEVVTILSNTGFSDAHIREKKGRPFTPALFYKGRK